MAATATPALPAARRLPDRPDRLELICLMAILAFLCAALWREAWVTGITVDEPSHMLSADLYWQGKDVLRPRDMPPLIKIAGGWVLRILNVPLPPPADPVWETQNEWNISQRMVELLPRTRVQRFVFLSRLPFTIFPLLVCSLLWWWGRQLFSPPTGLLLALLFAIEPTALGHGALFKNDIAATFGFLLFWYGAWRFWREPRGSHLALLVAGALAAILAKMSMLILLPIAFVMVPVRYYTVTRSARRAAAALLLTAVVIYAGAVAAVQFETVRLQPADFTELRQHADVPAWFVAAAHIFAVLPAPAPLWQGTVSLFDSNGGGNQIYLFGDLRPGPRPLYFLAALAVKAPLPLQMLVLYGAMLLLLRLWRGRLDSGWICIAFPPLLYIGAASQSSLQLGIRLILPALPFGILIAGAAVERLRQGRAAFAGGAVLLWLVLGTALVYPHGISYFNLLAGGPENGLKYLSDSNIDWGQDLPSLADWARRPGSPPLRIFYFGNDNPYRLFPPGRMELLAPPWSDDLVKGTVFRPDPGVYAVSVTLLPGSVFDTKYKDYFKVFRAMHPIGRAGYSIFLYRVDTPPPSAQARNR